MGEYLRAGRVAGEPPPASSEAPGGQALHRSPRMRKLADHQQALTQRKANRTGLPDILKTGAENLSGLSLDGVRVHYRSPRPAALDAHAFTQGSQIHLAPGQERQLPHETWHVVQQMRRQVRPTLAQRGVPINDDPHLEREADVMGARAMRVVSPGPQPARSAAPGGSAGDTVQRAVRHLRKGMLPPIAAWKFLRSVGGWDFYEDGAPEAKTQMSAQAAAGGGAAASSAPAPAPAAAAGSGHGALRFLPHESSTSNFERLQNAAWMAKHDSGHFAPHTVASTIGVQNITPHARARLSNEQGKALLALNKQMFPAAPQPKVASAAQIMRGHPDVPRPPDMKKARQTQSLHGVARSLGGHATGTNPKNYAAGSMSSNLAMQALEDPLGRMAPAARQQFAMQTTFHLDPKAPVAHGISMEVKHGNAPHNVVEYNLSGMQTADTQQSVLAQQAKLKAYLQQVLASPPQALPSLQQLKQGFPAVPDADLHAALTMLQTRATLRVGNNPWAAPQTAAAHPPGSAAKK